MIVIKHNIFILSGTTVLIHSSFKRLRLGLTRDCKGGGEREAERQRERFRVGIERDGGKEREMSLCVGQCSPVM